ncbi:MAG: hypothetical protein H6831_16465 [Planctomycetes bacterium]|nr:hypothetical protein [Planctomycetota bacterium]MCB9905995.1 hypothetical protein [Planctomycetota bacterium]
MRLLCSAVGSILLFSSAAFGAQGTWPEAPPVEIEWQSRSAFEPAVERLIVNDEWIVDGERRHARLTERINNVAFIAWFEQQEGVDATRVTVAAINGFAYAGPRYFRTYKVHVGTRVLADIEGQHVIVPRGALIRRTSVGPDEAVLRNWTYLDGDPPVPDWAPQGATLDTAWRTAFPMVDLGLQPVDLGPYVFFWKNRGFEDSHGGWGIAPFHGGPDDWLTCPEGRRNREAEMLLEFQRPIWMLDDDFEPLVLEVPYWMGRTELHQPPEFQYSVDGWCSYAAELKLYQFPDLTHLSRGTSGAAALARWDCFAVDCLKAVLQDFKMANSLTRVVGLNPNGTPRLHPGATQDNPLLFPLWKKLEVADGPLSSGGDRGLAHSLRLLRWCRGHVPPERLRPHEEAMRRFARKLADEYGVTSAPSNPDWVALAGGGLTKPLRPPFTQAFHQQLVTYEFLEFGGLQDLGEASADFLTQAPPAYFELRRGEPRDTVFDRNNSADEDQLTPYWSYVAYGNFTHDVLNGFPDAFHFLAGMATRGVNDGSQDLDSTPRHLWESELR